MNFDFQPVLSDSGLTLRPLMDDDFDGLFEAANDPKTWAGHPVKTRYQRDVFAPYFEFLLKKGGTLAVVPNSEKIIGCSRYYVSPDALDCISIGFTFLSHEFWGGGTNFAMKKLMLGHAFESFDEVWFHIDPTNIRSQKATAKFGAKLIYDTEINLGGRPAPFKCYSLSKADWQNHLKAKA